MQTPTPAAIDLNPHDLQEVLQILNIYAPFIEIRAFGSRVRWTAKPYSDLDLALMTTRPLSLEQAAQLREAFDESTIPFKVDFVDWTSTSGSFRKIIDATSTVIRPAALNAAEDWLVFSLDEALEALLDYRGKTPEKTTSGIPLITAKIVKNGRIETPTEFINPKSYSAWMTRGLPKIGDVVLTTEAPLGQVAQLDSAFVALAQRIVVLRGKPGILDNTYLRYLLQTYEMQEQLASRATGTTVVGIKQSELRKIALRLPPIEAQKRVAVVLSALDKKIELNRSMNETLEAMARAIFQSWFVDFDPVRAKTSGESADSICRRLGLTPEILALFPDGFENSELGAIPKEWSPGTLGDLADNMKRGIQPDKISPTTPYIALEHMPRRRISLSDWGYGNGLESSKFEFQKGEILFGKLRPYFHKVGVAPLAGVCSTDILVVAPKSEVWFGVVLGHVSSVPFVEHTDAGSTGTKMPRTSWPEMSAYRIPLPTSAIAKQYSAYISAILGRMNSAIFESKSLGEMRDSLLPKLLSGELPVGAAASEGAV